MTKSKTKSPADPVLSSAQSLSKVGEKPWSLLHAAIAQSKWCSIKGGYATHLGVSEGGLRAWLKGPGRVPLAKFKQIQRDFPTVDLGFMNRTKP